MILSAHQPAYLPWLGYFDKIASSDLFVYLDSVQFEKNSFINRNKIKTPTGSHWLTIPVKMKGHFETELKDIEIENKTDWRKDHLKTIYMNYKKAKRFADCYPKLEQLFNKEHQLLSELCWDQLLFWLKELGIRTKISRSSELPITSKKSGLVLDLCRHFSADRYISGALGKDYLKTADFTANGIAVEFQAYVPPTYPQLWGDFIPNMSILDFWMNTDDFSLITEGVGR